MDKLANEYNLRYYNFTKDGRFLSPDLVEKKYIKSEVVFRSGCYFGGKKAQIRKHNGKISRNYKFFFTGFESAYKDHRKFARYYELRKT